MIKKYKKEKEYVSEERLWKIIA